MAEPIYLRVRRILSASIEDVVDRMERAGGVTVMAEAVREADRALDEIRGQQEAATARKLQAIRQQRMLRDRAAALVDKAKVAMEAGRDDLAEAALSRQLDFEAQAERLDAAQANAAEEAGRLDECVTALATRKAEMEEALASFQMAHRDAALGGDGPSQPHRNVERQVERAEKAFDRAMSGAGGVGFTRADGKAAAKVAEIDVIQKSAVIAQRMAALRAEMQAG
jgi:phage shock protein A